MKRRWADPLIAFFLMLAAVSCATAAISMFSLDNVQKPSEAVIGIVKGSVDYGRGYYLPGSQSTLDISLMMIEGETNTELSHQRIRNIQRFPFQFSIRFDESELKADAFYVVILTFTNDGNEYLQVKSNMTSLYPPDNISLILN